MRWLPSTRRIVAAAGAGVLACSVAAPAAGSTIPEEVHPGEVVIPQVTGDAAPGSDDLLVGPVGLDVDAEGTLYIADRQTDVVRALEPDGTITTVAGNGSADIEADGGPADEVGLLNPRDVAAAEDGTLYIAEDYDAAVRAVDPEGTITTVEIGDPDDAQSQQAEIIALAAGPGGTLYVGNDQAEVLQVEPGGDATTVLNPEDFAAAPEPGTEPILGLDAGPDGTLYAAGGAEVLAVDPEGTVETLLTAEDLPEDLPYEVPSVGVMWDVAADDDGNIYVSGPGGGLIADAAGGLITGHGIPGRGTAVDSDGHLYLADPDHPNRLHVLIDPLAADPLPDAAAPGTPDRQIPGTDVDLANAEPGTIAAIPAIPDEFHATAIDTEGGIYFAGPSGITQLDSAGQSSTSYDLPEWLRGPVESIQAADDGTVLFISDGSLHRLYPDGTISTLAGGYAVGYSALPESVAEDQIPALAPEALALRYVAIGGDTVYLASRHQVFTLEDDGTLEVYAGTGLRDINAITANAEALYISDQHGVYTVDAEGTLSMVVDGRGSGGDSSSRLALDTEGYLYIVDEAVQDRILRLAPNGALRTIAGGQDGAQDPDSERALSTELDILGGLTVDGAGNLYFADVEGVRVIADAASAPAAETTPPRALWIAAAAAAIAAAILVFRLRRRRLGLAVAATRADLAADWGEEPRIRRGTRIPAGLPATAAADPVRRAVLPLVLGSAAVIAGGTSLAADPELGSFDWSPVQGLLALAFAAAAAALLYWRIRLGPWLAADSTGVWVRSGGSWFARPVRLDWAGITRIRIHAGEETPDHRFLCLDFSEGARAALDRYPDLVEVTRSSLAGTRSSVSGTGSPIAIPESKIRGSLTVVMTALRQQAPSTVEFTDGRPAAAGQ